MSLNSDELGRKGQARFAEICSDAKLIRNPSTEQDRTGWDFFVEFDHEPLDKNTTLDKRLSPISTHIQIKTIWSTSDRFKMRLSAAERLAKEPKPTFIYVFKVNTKLEYVSAYLVHMLDQNLFAVLKRLRREQVVGTKRINRKFISFRASVCGQKIEPTGEAFRQAVFHACGADIDAYMAKKREQIKSLGFEPGAFLATTRLKADGYSGFVDALLGLKPIEVTGGEAFETRFGIKLKLAEPHIGRGTMQIKPERADRCTISFRESKLSVPATFEADIILPPLENIPKEHLKFLIKSRLFRFFVTSEKIQFSTDQEEIRTATLKIDEWIPFYRMLIALCHGADITVVPERLSKISFVLKFPPDNSEQHFHKLYQILESAQRLLRLAAAPDPEIQIDGVWTVGIELIKLDKMFLRSPDALPISFQVNWPENTEVPEQLGFLYVNYIEIGGVVLAHYSIAEMRSQFVDGRIVWKSHALQPCEIRYMRTFPADYESFIEDAKAATNGCCVLDRRTSDIGRPNLDKENNPI